MTALAFAGKIMDSQTLARSVNTNPVVVRRLLLALRRAGLVETFAGQGGGARLGERGKGITLRDIYDAVEPRPVIAINQRKAWKHCPVSCEMKKIMTSIAEEAENALRNHLASITLTKLVRRIG